MTDRLDPLSEHGPMNLRRLTAAAMLVAALVACSDGGTDGDAAPRRSTTSTTAASTTSTTRASSCGKASDQRVDNMLTRLCARRATVDELESQLGIAAPDETAARNAQKQLCAPGFHTPTRDSIEVQYAAYIRGRAQADEALGRRWLRAGILTKYSRTDSGDGTFLVDLDFDHATLAKLSAADLDVYEDVATHPDTYCP
jgi:hypothetical protein